MSDEERTNLVKKIEEIRTNIDILQPEYEQQVRLGAEEGSSRATLMTLRRELARDMDALHAG